jgi:hypothetical protein
LKVSRTYSYTPRKPSVIARYLRNVPFCDRA